MLEAEPDRECELKLLLPWEGVKVIGEFSAELARELNIDVAEMGEMRGRQSGGLVTLR